MIKVAFIVLADTQTPEGLGRVVNAMMAVKEFQEANEKVKLIFDGAGTRWISTLSDPEHQYHELFNAVKDRIEGVCKYCAHAFQVEKEVESSHLPFSEDYEGHPSFRQLMVEGYQIITF